ncbi:hypothetical protein FF38_01985 [Lucilia cuprina]|uniref:Uncharacterized protein n=1 Tax=Lucilia cuprina TaxID=7375 RepID=A0A0L0BRL5_LUCCU|nr:hypothetical protein FF38_01985 [Lucilia cuprina]
MNDDFAIPAGVLTGVLLLVLEHDALVIKNVQGFLRQLSAVKYCHLKLMFLLDALNVENWPVDLAAAAADYKRELAVGRMILGISLQPKLLRLTIIRHRLLDKRQRISLLKQRLLLLELLDQRTHNLELESVVVVADKSENRVTMLFAYILTVVLRTMLSYELREHIGLTDCWNHTISHFSTYVSSLMNVKDTTV